MVLTSILLPALLAGLVLTTAAWLLSRQFSLKGAALPDQMLGGLLFLLAFVLGLTIASENSTLNAARSAASAEANAVAELWWIAHSVHQPEHAKLQALLKNYTTIVADKEWPLLATHKSSPDASAAVRAIRENLIHYTPHTPKEQIFYPTALSDVTDLFDARRARVAVAVSPGVPAALLGALIFLTAICVLGLPLSGRLNHPRDVVLYGIFAALFVAAVFFVNDINNPFKGTVMVHPTAFNNLFTSTFLHVS